MGWKNPLTIFVNDNNINKPTDMKQMISKRVTVCMRAAMMLAVVMTMMFAPATQALAQTYKLGGNYVKFTKQDEAGQNVETTEAEAGEKVTASVIYEQIPQGKYFRGEYSSQDATLTANWEVTETWEVIFTMPAKDVTINAVLANQQDYTIDLTKSTTAVISEEIISLLSYMKVGGKECSVYDDKYNWYLDLNVDDINDLEVKSTFDATTGEYIFSIEQLSGDGVYKNTCSFALNVTPLDRYKSLTFKFKEVVPVRTLQAGWITLSGDSFTYDGTEHKPTVTVKDGNTSVAVTLEYSKNRDAGEATVTVTASAEGYTGSVTKIFTITPKPVTITADGETKVYDGQPLTKNSYTHTELASGDAIKSVTVTGSQTDAGTSENVPSGAVIQNTANENVTDNYAITYTNGTLTVTKASLNITAEGYSGVYDGAAHGITVKNVPEGLTVKYSEDNTNFGSSELEYTNICEKTIYWKVDNDNYDLTSGASGNAQVTITPKAVTISGVKAKDKIYDGTTSAVIDAESAIIDGKVEGDVLTVNAQSVTAAFADANAGGDKTVTLSGNFTLAGTSAGNYVLSAQPASATGTIEKKEVTISGVKAKDKVYDGTTAAEIDAGSATFDGKVEGDDLTVNAQSVTAAFADAEAGKNKSVTIISGNFTLAGEQAGNYTLSAQPQNVTGTIEPKPVTVSGLSAEEKNYDPNNNVATINCRGAVFNGLIEGDELTISDVTGTYIIGENVDATLDVTLDYTNATLGGKSAANYKLATEDNQATTTITIHKVLQTFTITFDPNGGTGEMDPMSAPKGETVRLTENKFTQEGYNFKSWNTKADGSGDKYEDKQSIKIDEDLTLYAQWEKEENIIETNTETVTNLDGSTTTIVTQKLETAGSSFTIDGEGGVSKGVGSGSGGDVFSEISKVIQELLNRNVIANAGSGSYILNPILVRTGDASNVLINSVTEKDAEGQTTATSVSLTVKQTGDSDPTQIAICAGGGVNPDAPTSGTFGNFTWEVSKSDASSSVYDVLTISDSGQMDDMIEGSPWDAYQNQIKTVIIGEGVTSMGHDAFASVPENTTVGISITAAAGSQLRAIDTYAFSYANASIDLSNCTLLEAIGSDMVFSQVSGDVTLPSSVTSICQYAFENENSQPYPGNHVYITVPDGNVLKVTIAGVTDPVEITPTNGKADIINCLFDDPSKRIASRALTLALTDEFGHFTWEVSKSDASSTVYDVLTISGSGKMKEGSPWKAYKDQIKTVIFESVINEKGVMEGVTSIGNGAFFGFSSLTSVTIPAGVTSIDDFAFFGCSSLTSVTIPASVKSIGNETFNGCSSLKSVTIPAGVTSIGYMAFIGCSSLTSVTIPASVTSIGNETFNGCSSLTSVTIPAGVTSIGDMAFRFCSAMKSLTFAEGSQLQTIGNLAFDGLTSLTSNITIPASVTSIWNGAFGIVSKNTTVGISITAAAGSQLTAIDKNAFSSANASIDLSNCTQLKAIGSDLVFNQVSGDVTLPSLVTSICQYAFGNQYSQPYSGNHVYITVPDSKKLKVTIAGVTDPVEVTPTNGKADIIDCLFANRAKRIASRALTLKIVDASTGGEGGGDNGGGSENPENPNAPTSGACGDNVTWELSKSTGSRIYDVLTITGSGKMEGGSPWSAYKKQIKTVIIGEGVTSIGSSAFYGCSSLTSVNIPEHLTSIGVMTFFGCSSLKSVTIPAGVTSIGINTFHGCSAMTSLTFAEGSQLQTIDDYAFYGLTSLTSDIILPASVTSIGISAFSSVSKNTTVGIHITAAEGSQLTAIHTDAFSYANASIDLSNCSKLEAIGSDLVFRQVSGDVTLPSSVTSICQYAFENENSTHYPGKHVYVTVPSGKALKVTIDNAEPVLIAPNDNGMADIIDCLFANRAKRIASRALTLEIVDASTGGDNGGGSASGQGQEPSTQEKNDRAATTMTVNYKITKNETGEYGRSKSKITFERGHESHHLYLEYISSSNDLSPEPNSPMFTRGATAEQEEDDEIEIVSGREYEILHDGYVVLNFYTPDADITVNSIIIRSPGDANNDGYVNAADIVEMINAKDDKASERFNFINADIDRDGKITQRDIDFVVKYIMETGL
jgi:hypothetical protein